MKRKAKFLVLKIIFFFVFKKKEKAHTLSELFYLSAYLFSLFLFLIFVCVFSLVYTFFKCFAFLMPPLLIMYAKNTTTTTKNNSNANITRI